MTSEKMEEKIKELIKKGESEKVEFKESLSVKDEIGESVSAFSNSTGGRILIGVSDFGEIKGVEIGKKTIEELANYIKQNTDNHIYPSINIMVEEGKNILIIEVKECKEKPVFFRGKTYKRVGKSNHSLSASEIRKLAKEGSKDYWDEQICERASLEDIDEKKVRWFLMEAKKQRELDMAENISVSEVLMKLKLMKDNKITNAGVLLFGKNPQDFFIQSEVKCIRFSGNNPIKPYLDFRAVTGNVIDIIDGIEDFIFRNIRKAVRIIPGKIEREERYEYPEEAIREAIVNSIAHRNYFSPSNVQVRIFDDYMEIWNPGELPEGWTIENLKQKHESIPKNPLLFKQLFWIRYVEDVGGGTLDIIEECKEWGLPDPEFEFSGTSLVIIFRRAILTEQLMDKLGLNDRQKKAIKYISEKERITTKEYAKVNLKISERTARHDLNDLVKRGLIKKIGTTASAYYQLSSAKFGKVRQKGGYGGE